MVAVGRPYMYDFSTFNAWLHVAVPGDCRHAPGSLEE